MFCKYCGKPINPSPFCKHCGRAVVSTSQNTPATDLDPTPVAVADDPIPIDSSTQVTICPFCKEEIRVGAIKCKHCGSDLSSHTAARQTHAQIPSPTASAPAQTDLAAAEAAWATSERKSKIIVAVVGVIILAGAGALYFNFQPGCDSPSVQQTLFSVLDEKVLYLQKNGLSDGDVTKRLEVITKTSSNDDAKGCSANLILNFPKPIADQLAAAALSKDEPNVGDPNVIGKMYLRKMLNTSTGQLEVRIDYKYTKDAVMIGGGLEGLALVGLDGVMKYVGDLKRSAEAAGPAPASTEASPR
jgi:hypothetical protein